MDEITFNLYCTSVRDALNRIKELKEAYPNDRLQLNVNIKDDFYNQNPVNPLDLSLGFTKRT